VTVGAIHGGTKASIIPDEVKMLVSVRALDDKGRDRANQVVERIVKGTTQAAGIPDELAPIVKRSAEEKVSAAYNDPALSERLSRMFARELGVDKVRYIKPRMAGSGTPIWERSDESLSVRSAFRLTSPRRGTILDSCNPGLS
jgi:hippurate hydrolase